MKPQPCTGVSGSFAPEHRRFGQHTASHDRRTLSEWRTTGSDCGAERGVAPALQDAVLDPWDETGRLSPNQLRGGGLATAGRSGLLTQAPVRNGRGPAWSQSGRSAAATPVRAAATPVRAAADRPQRGSDPGARAEPLVVVMRWGHVTVDFARYAA